MASQLAAPVKGDKIAIMTTNKGVIKFKLFEKECPKTVENFTTHAKNGYYDGLILTALEKTCKVMSSFGKILCEHPKEIGLPETVNDFYCYKKYNYGKIVISAYRRKENE